MAVPAYIVWGVITLLSFGGGVVTHAVLDEGEGGIENSFQEAICDYNEWHRETLGNDDDWIQYYNENCQQFQNPPEDLPNNETDLLDLNTWSPIQLGLLIGLFLYLLIGRRDL